MPLTAANFQYIAGLARDSAAIVIDPGKEYLVETRLSPIAEQEGFATLDDYINAMRAERVPGTRHERAVDALTTNETSFFRDFHPFETLRQHIIPKLIEQRSGFKRLSFWSAACSTGQEPYTIAMLLRECFPQLNDWTIQIVGTDLSPTVLKQAGRGSYSQFEVNRGLPASYLIKYFTKVDDRWVLKDNIRQMVKFSPMNLIKPWPILPVFDVVFIRNVMIYFDVETKKRILKRIRNCLQPAGSLFLGTAETTMNIDPQWTPTTLGRATVYQAVPALAAAA